MLDLPAGVYVAEPCFVPDPQGRGEDNGWLLAFVTDLRRKAIVICYLVDITHSSSCFFGELEMESSRLLYSADLSILC